MYPIYLVDLFFLTLNKIVCFVIKSCILCLKNSVIEQSTFRRKAHIVLALIHRRHSSKALCVYPSQ